ncbi:MAG TPA: BREX system P-loop protein BrxC, partial [Treponemataceae bacterium]|nr:BREX system P-loop protein BrxC [Treponemataceae bacterium]
DVILFNIDSLSFQNDEQAAVLKAFFGVFNRKRGFCFLYPHIAHVESFLVKKGVYEDFKKKFEALNGSSWETDREDYVFYADEMLQAIREALPNQSENAELADWITNGEKRYPLTIENFAREVADYVDTKGRRLLFMADEMGQFIGMDSNRMLNLQTIVENLGTQAKGKAWVFVTSQEDIDSVLGQKIQSKGNDFSKIQGRFYTRFSLSSSSIAEVIQKRILQKTPSAEKILSEVYAAQHDILLNQMDFDHGTPTMPRFTNAEEYCRSYPFAPYQFNLLQDVFDAIRSVGATGLNLSKGERSMLEAFQTALKAVGSSENGALVPLANFFPTVQSFLDGSVGRVIFNAQEIPGITEFDIELLKTLFLIRYLRNRRIPGTVQNLCVLTLSQVNADMVTHRRAIEDSLTRLEKENLVTRENEEFIFLTIEEQNITREIQNTEVSETRETRELAGLLFRDQFDGRNKYRHSNGKSFDIQLNLDGYNQTVRGDIWIEFYSPISGSLYETKKANPFLASGGNSNIVAILPETPAFYRELSLYLKTDLYLAANMGRELTNGEQNIIAQKSRENVTRRNRLVEAAADIVAGTTVTILGSPFQPKSKGKSDFLMEICEYYVTAQFTKLNLLAEPSPDWERTVRTLLSPHSDVMIDEHNIANPKALEDIRQFIMLSHAAGKAAMLSDVVAKYGRIPYGWPDGNVQVLIAYLFRQGEVLVWHNSGYPEPAACIDLFIKSSLYDKVRIEKAVGIEDAVLENVTKTVQTLFIDYPPATMRDLAQHIRKELGNWQQNVRSWKETTLHNPASYPGTETLKEIGLKIAELMKCTLDTDLITTFNSESEAL